MIDTIYRSILEQLSLNKRPRLVEHTISNYDLMLKIQEYISTDQRGELSKIICILSYHPSPSPEFWPFIFYLMRRMDHPEDLKDGIALAIIHIVGYCQKHGVAYPEEFDRYLIPLFYTRRGDVFHSAMSALDLYGHLHLKFKDKLQFYKPSLWSRLFNTHMRAGYKILKSYRALWREFEKNSGEFRKKTP